MKTTFLKIDPKLLTEQSLTGGLLIDSLFGLIDGKIGFVEGCLSDRQLPNQDIKIHQTCPEFH